MPLPFFLGTGSESVVHRVQAKLDRPPVTAHAVTKPPRIDGQIEEAEWGDVPVVHGLFDAETGTLAAETGKFWLAYDSKYIYFAARLEDKNPKGIRATEYRTNVGMGGGRHRLAPSRPVRQP